MKLQLNGTGASEAFPSLFCTCKYCTEARELGGKNLRRRTSSCIDEKILIDFSADTYALSTQAHVDLSKIHHLIVTHSHADHFFPTDFHYLLPPFCIEPHPFTIYGNSSVHKKFKEEHRDNAALLSHVKFCELTGGVPFFIDDYKITPVSTLHDAKEDCFIYIMEKDSRELLYAHDSTFFPEETWRHLSSHRFSLVVLDCTSIEVGHHFPNHMGLPDNILVKERMQKEGMANENTRFVITHFAHTFNPLHEHTDSLARTNGFIAAFDGMVLDI